MLDNLSKYVYEVYRQKSVSAAAKKLYLSQPALSAAIKKAEKEIGAPIFNRKTVPFTLTAEGALYIDSIEKILKIENETKSRIQDISLLKSGTLKIGTATHLSFYVIPKICEVFRRIYPSIDISVVLADSDKLPFMLHKNIVDLIFVSGDENFSDTETSVLFIENFIIAMRQDCPGAEKLTPYALTYREIVSRCFPSEKAISDMSLFSGIEFVYTNLQSGTFKKRKMLFGEKDITPHITTNLARQQISFNLMYSGFGAFFTTDAVIATMPEKKNCIYFAIKNENAKQNFSICYSSDITLLSYKIASEFTKTAKKLFDIENPLHILCAED